MTSPPVDPDRSSHDPRDDPPPGRFSRRTAIGLGGAALAGASLLGTGPASASDRAPAIVGGRATVTGQPAVEAVVDALRPEIAGREAWGNDLPVSGEVVAEDDVRFLLVHHTASTNDYGPDDVVDQIREFHRFHTGPEKNWPDVAYNFFVDRFGRIWEARVGSIDGPVRGDATGGSQGFALLCALIGNHAEAPITAEAQSSMVALLAWLAERHAIDTSPGATVDFVSRGSNRWPSGAAVTARTISGHRDMSTTTCPGDFAYDLLDQGQNGDRAEASFPARVSLLRSETAAGLAEAGSPADASSVTVVPAPATSSPATAGPEGADGSPDDGSEAAGSTDQADAADGPEDTAVLVGVGLVAVAVLVSGIARFRRRTGA